jgi:allantoicase
VITLEALNAAPSSEFVARLGGIFEHSAWVAERTAAARPFASRQQLLDAMRATVQRATPQEQLALIRAHPELGARGRRRAQLTTASSGEQAAAGLDACTDEDFARLQQLNAAYLAKFDFPFIIAVRGHDPASIIAAFESRLANERAIELQAALREIGLIAGHRLADAIAEEAARDINLADERLGAAALFATDEFFGSMARMLQPGEPEWRAGVYDAHGKWMDGWETRRRRDQGHDHCVLRLAAACTLTRLDIDTRFFTGNYPPHASVQACRAAGAPDENTQWTDLLSYSALQGDQHNFFELESPEVWTHLKLHIYPDGGVARLRAYGRVHRDWTHAAGAGDVDLAAALNGGLALACSDEHYGSMRNLLLPGRGASMADGWETRRRRGPGFDWVVLRLGHSGRIRAVEIDTAHFKGNYPHQVSINGALLQGAEDADLGSQCLSWPALLEPQLLRPDQVHRFSAEVRDLGRISHVRVNMHPDGGLSRVRLFGQPASG